MRREAEQRSLADALIGGDGKGVARPERIAALVDWSGLDRVMGGLRAAPTGRPGCPPLVMPKALLLAQGQGLGDPDIGDALADRPNLRRGGGLAVDARVPDRTTLCRSGADLARHGLTERPMAAVDAQRAA